MPRRNSKQTKTLEKRLAIESQRLREEARLLPSGTAREALMRRSRRAETAAQMGDGRVLSNSNRRSAVRKERVDLTLQIRAFDRKLRWVVGNQTAIEKLCVEMELLRRRVRDIESEVASHREVKEAAN